ncbi:MAG: hypothetical protein HUU31_20800, partial [Anaerolineae bacterium]|nr:hypothetical protein [Anaerolineae bacterium]
MRSTANSRQTPRRVSAGLFVLISVLALAVLAITASGVGADSERAQVDPNAIVPGGPVSLVFVSPPASAAVGDTITLTVRIVAGATPVRGGRIFLNYNPSLLDWDEVNGFYGTGNFPLTITTGTSEAQGHLNINFFKEGTNTQTGNIQAFRVDFNVLACGTVNIPFVFDAPDRDTEIYQGTSGEVNALGAVTNLSFPVNEGCVEATPTSTSAPPTATATDVPPTATNTSAPPTATATDVPPTATNTSAPPTATATDVPPTATNTSAPP